MQVTNISEMALRPILAATMTSSCLQEVPAATAFAVASVIGRVDRNNSSGPEIINLVLIIHFPNNDEAERHDLKSRCLLFILLFFFPLF